MKKSSVAITNKVIMLITLIMNTITFGGYLAEVFRGGRTWSYLLVFTSVIYAPLLVSFIVYCKNPSSISIKYITLIGYLFFYIFVAFTSDHVITYVYFFCLIVMYFLYFDFRLLAVSCVIALAINIGKIAYMMSILKLNQHEIITDYMIEIASIIIFSASFLIAAKLSIKFNKEHLDDLTEEKKKQEEILNDVLKIAEIVDKNSRDVNSIIEELANGSDVISNAVNEISNGIVHTAESIQNQSAMSKNIHSLIVDTSELSDKMELRSNETFDSLNKGVEHVRELSEKSTLVSEKSEFAHKNMQELMERANEIQQITEIITGISEQTNMLSLNASIEAARAGEHGRGFAVVADQIRTLAIQSRDSTASIAQILESLRSEAAHTSESVLILKEVNDSQTELIQKTREVFDSVAEKMDQFARDVRLVTQRLDQIVESNNKVIDSINEISSLSEEATANAEEATSMTTISKEKAMQARDLARVLIETSGSFKKYL
jgi:methyl-accepting chemotaxis protein